MGYIGNQQTEGFSSIPAKQDLTGATGGTLTLTHAVSSPEAIDLYINHVRQEPTSSYSIVGTTVTLNGYTVVASDDIYVVYNSLALQTTVTPDASVSTAKIIDGSVTKAKIGTTELDLATIKDSTGTTTAMTIDSSGFILTPERPAFHFRRNAAMGSSGEITYTHTEFNIGNHAVQNTGVFTAPIDGIYQFSFQCIGTQTSTSADVYAKINGAIVASRWSIRPTSVNANQTYSSMPASTILLQLSANDTLVMNTTVALYSDPNSWIRFSGHLVG